MGYQRVKPLIGLVSFYPSPLFCACKHKVIAFKSTTAPQQHHPIHSGGEGGECKSKLEPPKFSSGGMRPPKRTPCSL